MTSEVVFAITTDVLFIGGLIAYYELRRFKWREAKVLSHDRLCFDQAACLNGTLELFAIRRDVSSE